MSFFPLVIVLLLMCTAGYWYGSKKALSGVRNNSTSKFITSRPHQFGIYVFIWGMIPPVLLGLIWVVMKLTAGNLDQGLVQQIENVVFPVAIMLGAGAGLYFSIGRISPDLRVRKTIETLVYGVLIIASTISILTTVGIVLSLMFETVQFFGKVPLSEFFFGLTWSPQTALRADQVGSSGAFGSIPLFLGTMLITFIAMCVAVPLGLMSAIYMTEYASDRFRAVVKPLLEILAGIPTVVYGFFAALTVGVFFRDAGDAVGIAVSSESALAAGVVMGMMIIPFVSSLSDDIIMAVPQSLRDGSYGLGATKSETVRKVILPAALPGIVGAVLLAVSRAIGETMIVVMAAGFAANLTANPLEAVTTVTVQIVGLLVGDQEFDSAKTLAAFALALVLFVVTLTLNVIALLVVRKYREKYD
ncbi:MAG: phosphate ABC transporter permease subunit PstC [Proteobacteria bacterium]|nr:phosphate ABC transporter permease subunit PstC [Pseudomonadota bacterium]